ncbi:MAG: (2Fe-2S)-binding protein [Acidobacteria bacterium]|nr:(2Fe-2S)-binding protein [Acidobacteriota bacterium]
MREAVRAGARSLDEVAEACGAGTDCGSCCAYLRRIVRLTADGVTPAVHTGPEGGCHAGPWIMEPVGERSTI